MSDEEIKDTDSIINDKILIKASSDNLHNVLAIPFIHALFALDDRNEINILLDEGVVDVFGVLPFKVHVYIIPKDNDSLAGRHFFSYNLHEVFNIDYFFDLNGCFKDTFLGTTFSAKNKIGFSNWSNQILLTHKVESKNLSCDTAYMDLYQALDFKPFKKAVSIRGDHELGHVPSYSAVRSKDQRYILIFVNKIFIDSEKNNFLHEIFDFFVGERFIIYPFEVETTEEYDDIAALKLFLQELNDKNQCIPATIRNGQVLSSLLKNASAVISEGSAGAILGSYHDKFSFAFTKGMNFPLLKYFAHTPVRVLLENGQPTKIIGDEASKYIEDFSEFVDYFYEVTKA